MEFIIFSSDARELVEHENLGIISVPTRLFVTDYTMVREFQTVEMRYNLSLNFFGNQQVITYAAPNRMVNLAEFLHEGKSEQAIWPDKFIRAAINLTGLYPSIGQEARATNASPIRTSARLGDPEVNYWQPEIRFRVPETHPTPVTPTLVGRLAEEFRERELDLLRRSLRNTIIPQER